MNAAAFRQFYDYHFSENRKIWDKYVTHLSLEQFTQAVDYSHGSVRNQLVHLMNMEPTFLELQLYNMRHVQEHAAQLNMLLGQNGVTASDWVAQC